MITIYLLSILIIIFSIIYLYKPINKFIKQKSIYSLCFKIPQKGYIPIFGHMFSLSGQVSKRGKFSNDFNYFNLFPFSDHFQTLVDFSHEYPNESVFCIWFFFFPAIIIKKVDYLEVCINFFYTKINGILILQSFFASGSKQITKAPDYALLDDWLKTGLLIRFVGFS